MLTPAATSSATPVASHEEHSAVAPGRLPTEQGLVPTPSSHIPTPHLLGMGTAPAPSPMQHSPTAECSGPGPQRPRQGFPMPALLPERQNSLPNLGQLRTLLVKRCHSYLAIQGPFRGDNPTYPMHSAQHTHLLHNYPLHD